MSPKSVVVWKIVAVGKNGLQALSSPTHFQQEIVLTLQSVPGWGSGLLPWAVSWHWIIHFSSCLHCFPKCIFINFLSSFIFSWSLQFFMWNTWELFLKVSFWAGDKCLFPQMVLQYESVPRGCSFLAPQHWIFPRTPSSVPILLITLKGGNCTSCQFDSLKCPFFLCVCCLPLAKLNLKTRSWQVYKAHMT